MQNKLLILGLLILLTTCKSFQAQEIDFDPIVLKAKETSFYADQVDWDKVNRQFIELTKGKTTVEELKPGLQFLINSLGDKHASVRSTKNYAPIVFYTGKVGGTDNRRSDFVNKVINAPNQFSYQLLEDHVGYLKVVGIGPGDVKEQAEQIRRGLTALKKAGVNQWILDLRYNGGGNINPMLAGLAPLIGVGMVGGAIDHDNVIKDYKIEKGQAYNYNNLICEMNEDAEIKPDEKVAVLLSRYTVSSGEMLAITFKGRQNTKFIGEATGGYTTGNGYDPVTDDFALVISQDMFIDRNKNKYSEKVEVDEKMEFQHNLTLDGDQQIERAMLWLNQNK